MCFCINVTHLTLDYARLVTILRSCLRKTTHEIQRAQKSAPPHLSDQKTLPFIVTIGTILIAKGNLDASAQERPEVAAFISEVAQGTLSDQIFAILLDLWDLRPDQPLLHTVIQCFGHLYQAFPTLMTHERSIAVMDSVLGDAAANLHSTLNMLRLIYKTLSSLVDAGQTEIDEETHSKSSESFPRHHGSDL